jgi:hypothetical protein
MSLPATLSGQVITSMIPISPFDAFLQIFNTNPYFIGLMMLLLNLGGRFITLEITKKQEQFLQLPWVRRILIFTVLFVATRNLSVAFWTTVIVVLLLGYLFNENSALCIFGQGGVQHSTCASPGEEMTPEEKEILQRLSAKAQRYQENSTSNKHSKNPQQQALQESLHVTGMPDEEDDVLLSDVYSANLSLIKNN